MAAIHILFFGEIAGCKIVPYIATHVKKALKYVISKYVIRKNIAYFHPLLIHVNNIKVYNNDAFSACCFCFLLNIALIHMGHTLVKGSLM